MEFLVIVLFVAAIVVVNLVINRAQRRRKQAGGNVQAETENVLRRTAKQQKTPRNRGAKSAPAGPRTSVEAAREANARLDAAQHQQVYAAIAQGHPIKAVKLYAQFTGVGVRAAGAAVENLAAHPQPFQPQRPAADPSAPAAAETAPTASPAAGNAKDPAAGEADSPAENADADKAAAAEAGELPQDKAAPVDKSRRGTAAAPASPEEDEISNWVKNLRPEDF